MRRDKCIMQEIVEVRRHGDGGFGNAEFLADDLVTAGIDGAVFVARHRVFELETQCAGATFVDVFRLSYVNQF